MSGLKTNDGRIVVISGASRCGKTAWAVENFSAEERAFAWDPEEQWGSLPGWVQVRSPMELVRVAGKGGAGRYAFCPSGDLQENFDFWAKVVFFAGVKHGPLVAIGEELADVSSPGKAPRNWGVLIRRGLKRGITIVPISQRWAEADKTAFGNASEFVMFRQSSVDDSRYLAKKTRVPFEEIEGLGDYEFLRYDPKTREWERSKLSFHSAAIRPKKAKRVVGGAGAR